MGPSRQNPCRCQCCCCLGYKCDTRVIPFDREAGYSRLLSQYVSANLLDDWLCRRLELQCLIRVLIVDIVSNTHELAIVVTAAEENDGNADDLIVGNARQVWRVGAEFELIHSNGNGADEKGVKLLIMLIAAQVSCKLLKEARAGYVRCRGADVGEFPLEIYK